MRKIIFATGNAGKAREVKNLLNEIGLEVISLLDLEDIPEIIEDADTFEGNAEIKAKVIYDLFKEPVIADDSGLSVEQLNGQPGVYSARYAGEGCTYSDNNKKLLKELEQFDEPHPAKFICSAVYYDGREFTHVLGEIKGKIINEFRGTNGFGYDPIFVPDEIEGGQTMAELELAEKNRISHRARAFNQLKEILKERLLS